MAYVRRRGKQLAIVHGERDPETGKVEQRIVFTFYSRPEALEAIGRGGRGGHQRFRQLLENEYPDLRFDWKAIRAAIGANLEVLPESYEYRGARVEERFRRALRDFVRELALADPQELFSAAELIRRHRHELENVVDLIGWRLKLCNQRETEWNRDDPFCWRSTLRGRDAPAEAEERAVGFYERRDLDRAEPVFKLLVECFDGYADGHNYLGLISLDRGKLEDAIGHFRKAVEIGRRLFPKRIARRRYGRDLATRPYVRALGNLTGALVKAGRYPEALAHCERLEHADPEAAKAHRATIWLCLERYEDVVRALEPLRAVDPSESLVGALALFGLGRRREAMEWALHGALHNPRAACLLARVRRPRPRTAIESDDHNVGVELLLALGGYLDGRGRRARAFLRDVLRRKEVAPLLDEVEALDRRRTEDRSGDRTAFDRLRAMQTIAFAREQATRLLQRGNGA